MTRIRAASGVLATAPKKRGHAHHDISGRLVDDVGKVLLARAGPRCRRASRR